MRDQVSYIVLAGVLSAVLCFTTGAIGGKKPPATFTATVTDHHDGDTFFAKQGDGAPVKYRLWAADAPELDQPFGCESLAWLKATIPAGTQVTLESHGKSYERPVVRVTVGDRDVCLSVVETGHAWADLVYAPKAWADVERKAMNQRAGLWGTAAPSPPWLWRVARGKAVAK